MFGVNVMFPVDMVYTGGAYKQANEAYETWLSAKGHVWVQLSTPWCPINGVNLLKLDLHGKHAAQDACPEC